MCIAIVKKPGVDIPKETLKVCAENNQDGCGFAYINTDTLGIKRIRVKKAMDFESFYSKYERAIEKNPDSVFLIHFRIKTSGNIDLANCHPFKIDRDHVFIHNGSIAGIPLEKGKSDTRAFNQNVLRVLPKGWNGNSGIKKLIEDFIRHSKIVVLNIDGDFNIYNESKGHWVEGVWYSNDSYKRVPVKAHVIVKGSQVSRYANNPYFRQSFQTPSKSSAQVVHNFPSRTDFNTEKIIKEKVGLLSAFRKVVTLDSFLQCDKCTGYKPISDLESFYILHHDGVVSFCSSCLLTKERAEMQDFEYIEPDAVVDWANEIIEELPLEAKQLQTSPVDWTSPWMYDDAEYYDDLDDQDFDDYTEGLMYPDEDYSDVDPEVWGYPVDMT
jgi:hypothetical protein